MTFWIGFNIGVLVLIAIDLWVAHRRSGARRPREAALWTLGWIALSGLFGAGIWILQGRERGLEFLTGYLVEYSLSVDNLFVFLVLFNLFKVPLKQRHRVLFWGVVGALFMRGTLIGAGVALVGTFHWILYVFGAFLLITSVRISFFFKQDAESHDGPTWLVRRLLPNKAEVDSTDFIVVRNGRVGVTPLLIILIIVEITDLLFALDSIPAVLGVSSDPFIVYSSNAAAILGLRSLFLVLGSLIDKLRYLRYGLCAMLGFIGLKMLVGYWISLSTLTTLAITAAIMIGTVVISLDWRGQVETRSDA